MPTSVILRIIWKLHIFYCAYDCVINLLENAYHNAFGIRSNLFAGIARLKDIEDVHRAIEFYKTRGMSLFVLCKDRFPAFEPVLRTAEEIYTAPLIKEENKWELRCSDDCASYLNKILDIDTASLSYRRNEFNRISAEAYKASILTITEPIEHLPFLLEIAYDSSLILHKLHILHEEERLRIRILWNEESYDYLYLFYEKHKLFLSCIHGNKHFFDDYYDLSHQITMNKEEILPDHGILHIGKEHLNQPAVFSRGLINLAIQNRVYDCVFHTVFERKRMRIPCRKSAFDKKCACPYNIAEHSSANIFIS